MPGQDAQILKKENVKKRAFSAVLSFVHVFWTCPALIQNVSGVIFLAVA